MLVLPSTAVLPHNPSQVLKHDEVIDLTQDDLPTDLSGDKLMVSSKESVATGAGSSDECSNDEQVVSSDEHVVSSDEQVVSSDEQVVSCDEQVVSSDKQVVSSDEQVVSSDEQVLDNNEPDASSDVKLSKYAYVLACIICYFILFQ